MDNLCIFFVFRIFIQLQIISEAHEQRQRDWEDEEENEMDRGRQKKVKVPKDPYAATTRTPGYNPFQEQENQKRWKRYHHGGGNYRHNFQRNKFKFQRFQHKFPKKNMNGGNGNSNSGGSGVLNVNRRNDS